MKFLKPLFWFSLLSFALAEALSFTGFFHPSLELWVMAVIGAAALILSFKDLRYGLLLVMSELVVGSQGYLFSLDDEGARISLRIMLWIIVMAIWFVKELLALIRKEDIWQKYRQFPYIKPLVFLAAAIVVGAAVGWIGGNDSTFFFLETKRWAYALVMLPFIASFRTREDLAGLLNVVGAGAAWLVIKTLVVVFIFSHTFVPLVYDLYDWTRLTLLGEITRLPSGFARVFMQSQIFLLPALFAIAAQFYSIHGIGGKKTDNVKRHCAIALLAGLAISVLAASLSRSFWVACAAAALASLAAIALVIKPGFRRFSVRSLYLIGSLAAGIIILFAIVRFPYPKPSADIDASLLRDRATQMEAGAASRWSLLPVMSKEIIRSPLWGFGFGKTLTYKTSDPRITASTTDGEYTTYAFEWGWLDIALKLGLLGVSAYLWLLWIIARDSWRLLAAQAFWGLSIGLSVLALAVVHFFTPYLNHPLGFGYLILMMLFLRFATEENMPPAPLPKF